MNVDEPKERTGPASIGDKISASKQSVGEVAAHPPPSLQQKTPLEPRTDSHLTFDDLIVYKPSFEGGKGW